MKSNKSNKYIIVQHNVHIYIYIKLHNKLEIKNIVITL